MHSKYNEIEAIIEDLVENTVVELFCDSFSTKKECEVALEILINKLEELDTKVFKECFDK